MRLPIASHRLRSAALFLVLSVTAAPAPAQAASDVYAADVTSVDAIIASLYDVISGPAGQARNWDRFRNLFVPGARLIPTGRRPDGTTSLRMLSPDEYAQASGPSLERNGFFEREISHRMERFGNIAHVFSTYDSKRTAQDPAPFARGINSIQLYHDGKRWWVVTIYWDSERPDNLLPSRYLERAP